MSALAGRPPNAMPLPIPMPASLAPKSFGLDVWMRRVLERAEAVRSDWDEESVHDLRVALRRCRTMADALSEVNPGPGWRKLKKHSRKLFHALGGLRDVQVKQAWVKKLAPAGDPVRKHMLLLLARQARETRESAERALNAFDRKEWRKTLRKLSSKARFFPLESVVFQRLALERLHAATELYQQARKRRSSVAWHRLRIGIKQFRYVVENFLPQRHEVWAEGLKHAQDLLGDVHDLDELRRDIRRESRHLAPADVARWYATLSAQRKARLAEFLAKMSGEDSFWFVWRAGFQWGHSLRPALLPQRRSA